ncbi:MAG: hypothetical protein ACI809_001318, partial [Candidatus Azotimanducaceae bacterium]
MHKVLLQAGLTPTDRHFADMLSRKSGVMDADLVLLFARLSQTLGNQNSCLRIDESALIERLRTQNCVTCWYQADIDYGNINTPLVLVCNIEGEDESALLYTNRFFQYESRIAENLTQRNRPAANPNQQYTALAPYFEDQDDPKQHV